MDLITSVPFFQQCSPEVVQERVLKLDHQGYMPHDYIVTQGEIGDEMYLVQEGECEVTVDMGDGKEKIIKTLTKGNYFGTFCISIDLSAAA